MPTCSAIGCQNRSDPGSNVLFYRIPVGSHPFQERRRQLWLQAIKQPDGSEDFIRTARVCSAHFISGRASVDSNSPDFVPSVFAYTDETPKSQKQLGSFQKKRKGDENTSRPEKRSNITVLAEQPAAIQLPDTGTPATPLVTKKRNLHNSHPIAPHKPPTAPETANRLVRPFKTFSKSEIQEFIKQEICATIKQSEHKMDELIKRIQKTDAEVTVSKYEAIFARLQTDLKKIKRREQTALSYVRKLIPLTPASPAGHNQRAPGTPPHTQPLSSRETSVCILDPPPPCPTASFAAPCSTETRATDTPDALSTSRTEAEGECGQSREPSNQGSPDTSGWDSEVVFCGVRLPRKRIVEGFWQRRLKRNRVVDLTEDGETDTDPSLNQADEMYQSQSQDSVEIAEQEAEAVRSESPTDAIPGRTPETACSQSIGQTEGLFNPAQEAAVSAVPQTPCGPHSQTTPQGDPGQPATTDPPCSTPSPIQDNWRSKLPPLPLTPSPAQLLDGAAAATNPPQQVVLTLARIRNPRGIGALWNVQQPDPRAAAVRRYHLYALQEDRGGHLSAWRSVGTLRAMPLPMACKLSDHGPANRFCFAIVSEDIYGRYGPYSQIHSISPGD